jgi:hypothetical protein
MPAAVLTAYVDDYAEVGERRDAAARGHHQPGHYPGLQIFRTAWSLPIRSRPATGRDRDLRHQWADLAVPPNFVFFRQASVEFYK